MTINKVADFPGEFDVAPAAQPQVASQPSAATVAPAPGGFAGEFEPKAPEQKSQAPVQPQGGHGNVQNTHRPVAQVVPGFTAVKVMQQAIIDFGKTVAGVEMFQKAPAGTGKQETGMGQHLGGHDPFSEFLFKNYLDKPNDKPGSQYQDVDLPHGVRGDAAIKPPDAISLRGWVSSMLHVGSAAGGGENKPDGKWGERTTNALRNILSFATAMIDFANEMGIKLGEHGDLNDFKARIPKGNAPTSHIEENAKVLTSQIHTLKGLFERFKTQVLSVPQWAKMISQENAVLGGKKKGLTTSESYALKNNGADRINVGPKTEEYGLTLNDLSSEENFKAFLQRANIPAQTPAQILQAIANLTSMIQQPLGF